MHMNMYWDEEMDVSNKKGNEDLLDSMNDDMLPVKAKRTSVWGEDDSKSFKNRSGTNIIEMERFQKNIKKEFLDDIPIIPDMDDLQDDSLNLPDVKKMVSVDESTYKELDNQFNNLKSEQVSFGNLGDIDLSFLTSKLYPENEVQPCTEVWTIESLYADLSKSST